MAAQMNIIFLHIFYFFPMVGYFASFLIWKNLHVAWPISLWWFMMLWLTLFFRNQLQQRLHTISHIFLQREISNFPRFFPDISLNSASIHTTPGAITKVLFCPIFLLSNYSDGVLIIKILTSFIHQFITSGKPINYLINQQINSSSLKSTVMS